MATAIERAEAVQTVALRTAADSTPVVDTPDLEQIVDAAARPDAAGHPVEAHDDPDRDWTTTYDLNAACAAVCEAKAALVANRFDLTIDGQGLSRAQLHEHFMKQARMWRSRTAGTIPRSL